MFKNAGLVPNSWRPQIHVPLAYNMDNLVFSWSSFPVWIALTLLVSCGWYTLVKKKSLHFLLQNSIVSSKDRESQYEIDLFNDSDSSSTNSSQHDTEQSPENTDITMPIVRGCSLYLTPVLFFLIWPVLNLDHWLATPLSVPKDLTAWIFYVLAHITFPILTSIWLYVFHAPGATKSFSIALGCQNIAGVISHMCFPTAPPWFIHMYGPDANANYDMPGYAAGLTRVDVALGTHIHSNGFHKSPIVFGAVPSLHSAMAVQVCLFLWYYANSKILRSLGVAFVCIQWWATIYLDHHFRFDLIVGCFYALIAFAAVWPYMRKKEFEFYQARKEGDTIRGSTMGMRAFEGFDKIQRFFDPYHCYTH
jgi:hypothetical protein